MQVRSTLVTQASTKIQNENSDDYPIHKTADAGRTWWVQTADPAGSSTNGDIWIELP